MGSITGGSIELAIIETPGHSEGSVTFLIDDAYFVGDLIFQASIGRTDLPGGSMHELLESVTTRIFSVEQGTLYPGHGGITDIQTERETNPFF